MAIDAVKIPQNVYVEDRIIGPVTLRQLIITGLGAGISYAIYATVSKAGVTNIVFLASCWIPAVIAAAFSFLKINDLTLFNIILLAVEGVNKPRQRVWVSDAGMSINIVTKPTKQNADTTAKHSALVSSDRIAEVTRDLQERDKQLKALTALGSEEIEVSKPVIKTPEKGTSSLPVNRNRVAIDELTTDRTIDGVLTHERMHHLSHKAQL